MSEKYIPRDMTEIPQDQSRFNEYLVNCKIETIALDQIPKDAMDYFETRSKRFMDMKDYEPCNFDKSFVIIHDDGSKTYVVQQTKTYSSNNDTEELTYIAHINDRKEFTGYGEMRKNLNNPDDYFKDKPFVGYTRTTDKHLKQGLGMQRLYIMNALTQMLYDLPLNSDTTLVTSAKRLWERLVQRSHAKKYKQGEHDRYVFLDKF